MKTSTVFGIALLLTAVFAAYSQTNNDIGGNQMQNDIVPNAQFPFGQPLKIVKQQDKSPKTVFVLGVYASAVHAKWYSKGKLLCKALAVASEPEIFWKGENAAEIIKKIEVPLEAGNLKPAEAQYNGPSGRTLDELYLKPLGLTRADVWLCDLVPYSLMNSGQRKVIENRYEPLVGTIDNLLSASIPIRTDKLTIDENRRNEILAELVESQAKTIILLGDDPIRLFLSFVSDCKNTSLAEFGKKTYGADHEVIINGESYTVIPLVHPRQSGGLGFHDYYWEQLHKNWIKRKKNNAPSRKQIYP